MLSNSERNGKTSSSSSHGEKKKKKGLDLGGLLDGGRRNHKGFQRVRTDEAEADLLDQQDETSSDDDDEEEFSVPALRA
jgi:hypothetical protein